jgi:hypothetical protein
VAVPAGIAADLVVVQAAFLLRGLEAFLDRPPAARDVDQLVQCGVGRAVGDVVGDLLGPADAAAGEDPVPAVLASWAVAGCDRAEIELAGFIDALLTETYLLIELANSVRFFEPWPSKGTARVAHPSPAYL